MLINKLDGVFQRNDVTAVVVIDVIQQSCQRGALTGTSGTGEQHQTAGLLGLFHDNGGQAQALHRGNLQRQQTQSQCRMLLLIERITAHPDGAVIGHGKVTFAGLFQLFHLAVIGQYADRSRNILLFQHFIAVVHQFAVNTVNRRQTHGHMQVGSIAFHGTI